MFNKTTYHKSAVEVCSLTEQQQQSVQITRMEDKEIKCEIINQLFSYDLDEILQMIFLHLSPPDLKVCRSVCWQWSVFIKTRLWESKPARLQLRARLEKQWREEEPVTHYYDHGMRGVNYAVCDEEIIVCGYLRGQARVYDISTGCLKYQLECNDPTESTISMYDSVQLSLGRTMIGAVTDTGTVSLWNKSDGTKLYMDKHHRIGDQVMGLKVTDDYAVTGGGDGSVMVLRNLDDRWAVVNKLYDNNEGITHIEADAKWMVTGSKQDIRLWDMEHCKLLENANPVNVKVWMLSFQYPHAYVVGGEDWAGVQVWDMVNCVLIRHFMKDGFSFHNIAAHENIITLSQLNEQNEHCSVDVINATELLNKKLEAAKLWKRSLTFTPGSYFEQINAVSNTTSLIVCHRGKISIHNFWKDRISNSHTFHPPDDGCIQFFSHEEDSDEEFLDGEDEEFGTTDSSDDNDEQVLG